MNALTVIAIVSAILVTAAAVSTVLHWLRTRRELGLYPPPGKIIDVDGTKMHLLSIGAGEVTVVLEAGLSGTYLEWSKVQPAAARHARVCSYDRVGLGYSELGCGAVDSETVARRLHRLLELAGISGPFLLVGHSYGGVHVRTFARLYPAEVVGMVLVDSAHENQQRRFPADAIRTPWVVDKLFRYGPLLARVGLYRLLNIPGLLSDNLNLPAEARSRIRMLTQSARAWRAMSAEYRMSQIETSRELPPDLPANLPLTVITQSKGAGSDLGHVSHAVAVEVSRIWLELQHELASLSNRSSHLIAEGTSHYVQLDNPECVINIILMMLRTSTADGLHQGLPSAAQGETPLPSNSQCSAKGI